MSQPNPKQQSVPEWLELVEKHIASIRFSTVQLTIQLEGRADRDHRKSAPRQADDEAGAVSLFRIVKQRDGARP